MCPGTSCKREARHSLLGKLDTFETGDKHKPMAYNLHMSNLPITVVETPPFLRSAKTLLSDDERLDLVAYLAEHPEEGAIMPETGGVRKLRWSRRGGGKSGGYRVIYYFHSDHIPLFALLVYGKNDKANLTKEERNNMRKLTSRLAEYGRHES